MNTNRMRLIAGVLGAIVLSAPVVPARESNLVLANFGGTLRISQAVPCKGVVNLSTPVERGLMDITPVRTREGVRFHLTRLEMMYTPFGVRHKCRGITAGVEFREIGVRLASAVTFTGEPIGRPEEQLYRFSIPNEQFMIFQSIVDNQPVPQPQTSYKKASEDVTGLIDLRQGRVQLNVTMPSKLHFQAGCTKKGRCAIDEALDGRLVTAVTGAVARATRGE